MIDYPKYSWLRFLDTNDVSWDDLTNFCLGEEWCYPVDNNLLSRFHLNPGLSAELVPNADFVTPLTSGVNTAITVNELRDGGATWLTDNLVVGMTVQNVTDDTTALLTVINTNIRLTLGADIFPAPAGDAYEISGWVEGADWRVNSGGAGVAETSPGAGSNLDWGDDILQEGKHYQVTITIDDYTAGSVTPNCGGTAGTARAAVGTFTEIITCGATAVFRLTCDAAANYDIGSVSVKQLDDVVIVLRDCETEAIVRILEEGAFAFSHYQYFDEAILVTLAWNEESVVNNNCYCVCVYNATADEIIDNPQFADGGNNWVAVTGGSGAISFAANTMDYTSGALPASGGVTDVLNPLTAGKKYIVRVTIDSITDMSVEVNAGGPDASTAMTTTGTHYWEVTAGGTSAGVDLNNLLANGAVEITEISFIAVEDFDRCSECFKFLTEQSSVLKYLFSGDEDQFGFKYGSFGASLAQQLYLHSRIGKEHYPEEMDDHLDSAGDNTILFGQSREQRQIIFADMPAWLHGAMAKAWLSDNINVFETPLLTVKYKKVPGDWEPAWEDFRNLAPVIIDVEEEDQADSSNSNC